MTTKFRAYADDGELPNLEFRSTSQEALMDAIARITSERSLEGSRPPSIIIEEVREPKLSDFFDFTDLVSAMRERMNDRIGNDDAFTEDGVAALAASVVEDIEAVLDIGAENSQLRIDGYLVVNRYRAEKWWVKDGGDNE